MGRMSHASKAGKHKMVQAKVAIDTIERKSRHEKVIVIVIGLSVRTAEDVHAALRSRFLVSSAGLVRQILVEEVVGERARDVMVPPSADAQAAIPSGGNVLTILFTHVSLLVRAAFTKTFLPADEEVANRSSPLPGHNSGSHRTAAAQQRQGSRIGLDRLSQLDFPTLRDGYVLYVSPSRMPGLGDQLGLFALQDIPGNILLGYYTGPVINKELSSRGMSSRTPRRAWQVARLRSEGTSTERGSAMRFINHSCEWNAFSKIVHRANGPIVGIFSRKAGIRAGAEVTYNYNLMGDEAQKEVCHCGTPNCRGTF